MDTSGGSRVTKCVCVCVRGGCEGRGRSNDAEYEGFSPCFDSFSSRVWLQSLFVLVYGDIPPAVNLYRSGVRVQEEWIKEKVEKLVIFGMEYILLLLLLFMWNA